MFDERRQLGQLRRVREVMVRDHAWRTLDEIAAATHDPPASISARLRDLRKSRFGRYYVERRPRAGSLYEYRVSSPATVDAMPASG